jgi:copper chaperone NosL
MQLSCTSHGPKEIHYGEDKCDYCSMNIVDNSFGTQLATAKGKSFKFDSIECLSAYAIKKADESILPSSIWLTDFNNPGAFVRVDSAVIVQSDDQNSPMGVGLMGFGSMNDALEFVGAKGGRILNWDETCDFVRERWRL